MRASAKQMGSNVMSELMVLMAMLTSFAGNNADLRSGSGAITRARNAGTVISVVVIGVVSLVGILIFAQVQDAMALESGDPLYESSNSIVDGFGNAMEFVPIILLVLLASVVIAVVQRMRM